MSNNKNLHKAKKNKNDEFYTQLIDIQNELQYYTKYFKDKSIYLNCDDPKQSKFWEYFYSNFKELGLKKLIATYYNDQAAYKTVYDDEHSDIENNLGVQTKLTGNGDFRSDECVEILKECDIVVTNPPFSLYREFINLLVKYNKQFLIIGTKNSALCKNIFPLLRDGYIWYGYNNIHKFDIYNGETDKLNGMCKWYTNIGERHFKPLKLTKKYYDYYDKNGNLINGKEDIYQKLDEFDAININKLTDIPYDYKGVMCVPITYIEKHNDNLFDIGTFRWKQNEKHFFTMKFIKQCKNIDKIYPPCVTNRVDGLIVGHINGKEKYIRIFIRKKN